MTIVCFEKWLNAVCGRDLSSGCGPQRRAAEWPKIEKKTKRYPSDLTDEEWARASRCFPSTEGWSASAVDLREVERDPLHGPSGGGLADAAENFPPWQTVYWWFRRFVRRLLFRTIHDVALMIDRESAGREASPSAAVIDSQTGQGARRSASGVTTPARRSAVASATSRSTPMAGLLMVNLTPADISDSAGAQAILDAIRKRWPWVKHLFADGAYDRGKSYGAKAAFLDFVIEIIRRIDGPPGLQGAAASMGGRAHVRLDDTLSSPRARLRSSASTSPKR